MSTKNYSIQVLRALSVLNVFLSHTPGIGAMVSGKYGVVIFLTLSVFLTAKTFNNNDKKYILKKVIKLIPLYYFFTILTFCFVKIFPNLFHSTSSSFIDFIKSLLFIPYAYETENGITYSVLNVGWYMNIQMWFYIIYYVFSKITRKYKNIILSFLFCIAYIISIVLFKNDAISIRYALPLLCCSFGLLLHSITANITFRITNDSILINLLLVLIFIIGYICFAKSSDVLCALICSIVVYSFYLFDIGRNNILTMIGDVSYEIYLSNYYI